jgi:multiple sugar transport system permease protein
MTSLKKQVSLNWLLPFLFLAPAFILYAVFFIVPVFYAGFLSFAQWNLISPNIEFIGLENYKNLFEDSIFWISLWNTCIYAVATVFPSMAIGILLAVFIEASGKSKSFFRTVFFMPVVASIAVTALVWMLLMSPNNGYINSVLKIFGIKGPNWLNDPQWAMLSIIFVGVWRTSCYNMVLYIAGLKGLDRQLFESAKIDGAGPVKSFLYITFPLLGPVNLFVLVVSLIQSFQVFTTINIMTHGGPNNATNVLVYQVWQEAFQFFDIGRSSAAAIVMFFLVLAVAIFQIHLIERNEKHSD